MTNRSVLLVAALLIAAAGGAASIYLARLNWRMSEAIVAMPWRHPIEIVSSVRGAGSEPLVRLYGDDWRVTEPVKLEELPPHVAHAFVAAEDVRFYRHAGVDPWGLLRATATNVRSGAVAEGGSTITQQLIKQKLLSNDRTFRRKIPEMLLAPVLTLRMSKAEVLEGYLNDVYLGEFGGAPVYGIDEASHVFFDKPAAELTADEAALIAGMIRAPNRDNPLKKPEEARARRDAILRVMHEEKWLDDDGYERARGRDVRLEEGSLPDAPYGHYLSALRTELASQGRLPSSGIRIVAHIDPEMQEAAERAAREGTAALRRRSRHLARSEDLQVAILSADPSTGAVRALVGSRDFAVDAYDRTRRMHRQPGSALKPFVYATALETRDFTPVTSLDDTPLRVSLGGKRYWSPRNYDERFRGPVALRVALEQSLNVPTVRLAEEVGRKKVARSFEKFGFEEEFETVPSLPLGVTEVSLAELVAAYSAFPSLGKVPELHLVSEVLNRKGRTIYRREPEYSRAVEPAVAWLTHDLLRGAVLRGTASRLAEGGLDHVAGKTGTTTDYRDAWFIGYAPDLVTGVWVGNDGGTPLRLSAAEAAVPLWSRFMRNVKTSRKEIAPPEGIVFRDIDPTNGRLWRSGCAGPVREAFLEGTEPETTCGEGSGTLLARMRGNPEPPEISAETWQRWNADPVIAPRRAAVRDREARYSSRGGIPEARRSRERSDDELRRPDRSRRDDARAAREARKREEKMIRDFRKREEKMRKEAEKRAEKAAKKRGKGRD